MVLLPVRTVVADACSTLVQLMVLLPVRTVVAEACPKSVQHLNISYPMADVTALCPLRSGSEMRVSCHCTVAPCT